MSKQTMEFHWGKHHQTYVTNVNNLVKGTDDESKSMEQIMMKASGGLFNNAAQVGGPRLLHTHWLLSLLSLTHVALNALCRCGTMTSSGTP
jgi:superoxide dismutase